jgi:hypothetical protein
MSFRFNSRVLAALMLSCTLGCGDGRVKFDLSPTSGRVMCEGQPVAFATVFFEPLPDGEKAITGKQGIGYADANGIFAITTYDQNDGAVIGKHRVRVGRALGEHASSFKCDCVVNEEVDVMQVEIVGGQENNIEIILKPGTKKEMLAAEKAAASDAEIDD